MKFIDKLNKALREGWTPEGWEDDQVEDDKYFEDFLKDADEDTEQYKKWEEEGIENPSIPDFIYKVKLNQWFDVDDIYKSTIEREIEALNNLGVDYKKFGVDECLPTREGRAVVRHILGTVGTPECEFDIIYQPSLKNDFYHIYGTTGNIKCDPPMNEDDFKAIFINTCSAFLLFIGFKTFNKKFSDYIFTFRKDGFLQATYRQ